MYEVWYNRGMKTVGHLTPKVIKAFELNYKPGEEITLSTQRKKHMEKHRQNSVILMPPMNAYSQRLVLIRTISGRHPNGQSFRNTSNVLMVMFWWSDYARAMSVPQLYYCAIKDSKLKNI